MGYREVMGQESSREICKTNKVLKPEVSEFGGRVENYFFKNKRSYCASVSYEFWQWLLFKLTTLFTNVVSICRQSSKA